MIAAEFADKVLQLLASVGETDEVLSNLDLPLYGYQVLDSMRTVQLILMIEEEFGSKISLAKFERERWRTICGANSVSGYQCACCGASLSFLMRFP
jgi:D-alanine--poly(phosphoribitol) ligase subunit 2